MVRTAKGSRVLVTGRDEHVLLSVYRYRMLAVGQVEQLHFPSVQTAARRIRLLAQAGYLAVTSVPGAPDRLVTLGPKGMEVVAAAAGVAPAAIARTAARAPRDHYFVRHKIALSGFRIALEAACRARADLALLGFLDDATCRRTPAGGMERYLRGVVADTAVPDRTLSRIPDGVFALARSGRAGLHFLEVDRGTEPIASPERGLVRVLEFYLRYLPGSDYQRYREDFGVAESFRGFRALLVTTSPERIRNIRNAGAKLACDPPNLKRFVWLATLPAVTAETILGPIWISLDPADETRYALVPTPETGGAR